MNTLTKCILILSASIAPIDTVFSATITGDGVIITPNIGIDATIDFRSNGTPSSPGLTLSFVDDFAAVSDIHRPHGLWQWQSLNGNSANQLLLQLGNWGTNYTPHLILMDADNDPSFVFDGGSQGDGHPAVFKMMTPIGTAGVQTGMVAGIEFKAGNGPGLDASTLILRNSTNGQDTVEITGGNAALNEPPSITIAGRPVVTLGDGSGINFTTEGGATGAHSAAFGEGTFAIGFASVTFGSGGGASGHSSASFGYNTQAVGDYSSAFGYDSDAIGIASAAFGSGRAQGDASFAGNESIASGYSSASFNWGTASGDRSMASGEFTIASGDNAFSSGQYTVASGVNSAAFGWGSRALGEDSVVFGFDTRAQGPSQFVIGRYNIEQGNPSEWIATDDLFIIGNGTDLQRANAMTVKKNGNATFSNSLAVGPGSIATGTAQTVVGAYNDTNTNDAGTNHTSGVFIIGAGTNSADRKNALRVRSDGVILISPSGDIDMGEFTAGDKP
jgi:hypothetical protein